MYYQFQMAGLAGYQSQRTEPAQLGSFSFAQLVRIASSAALMAWI